MRALVDIVFPQRCVSCGAPARWLCETCDASFPWLGAACARCAEPLTVAVEECARCTRDPPPFFAAFSAARYTGCARDALMTFKLGGERRAARAMAARMMEAFALRADLVTFVPATARSVRARGFNPAEELARAVARLTEAPCRPLLRKARETADQSGLDRAGRVRNVAGAFEPLRTPGKPGTIVLVDDVMTTGATARACARALSAMGQIAILTFARAG